MTADNLESYKKTSSFDQKIVSSSILINLETEFLNFFISFETVLSDIFTEKKFILNLIKNAQEFDSLCRQISSQLHEKLKENLSFVLHKNEILKKTNHVYIFHQKTIQNQFLELYYDCSSKNY